MIRSGSGRPASRVPAPRREYRRRPSPSHLLQRRGAVRGRGREKVFLRVSGYLPGRQNSADELRELVSLTLAEFDLTAEFDD